MLTSSGIYKYNEISIINIIIYRKRTGLVLRYRFLKFILYTRIKILVDGVYFN